MPTQVPGLDLLQPMADGEAGVLSVQNSVFLFNICFPLELATAIVPGVQRPQSIPGTQQFEILREVPTNCTDTSAEAYVLDRCLKYAVKYVDVWLTGADFAPNSAPRPNGYLVQMAETLALCATVYSAECIATYGALGCVRYTATQMQLSASPPAAASEPPPQPAIAAASTSDTRAGTLGAAIGGALAGGVLLAALVALAVWAVRRHRRSREPQAATAAGRHPSKTKLAADPEGAAAAQAEHGRPHGDGGGGYAHSEAGQQEQQQAAASGSPSNSGQQQQLVSQTHGSILSTCSLLVITHASPQHAELLPNARLVRLRGTMGSGMTPATSRSHSTVTNLQAASGAASTAVPERSAAGDAPAAAGPALVTLLPQLLGKGAFGSVYEGVFQGRPVAVKVITETLIDDEDQQAPQQQHLVQPVPGDKAPSSGSGGPKCSAEKGTVPALGAEQVLPVTLTMPHGSAGGAAVGPTSAPAQSTPASGVRAACEGSNMSTSISSLTCASYGDRTADILRSPQQQAPCEPCAPGARRPLFRELLRREVEVMGRCEHPSIVRLLAACLTPPRLCLVMELMETNLQRLVYTTPARLLPLPTVLHISIQVARGLEYLHPTITHRDLKPANVLINAPDSPWPVAKLADFGLSRMRIATLPTMHPEAGTPAYLAPECYEPDQTVVTHHADLYSLGVLIWAMLTGQEPWKGLTIPAVAIKVASLGERLPLGQLSDRRCPPQLRKIVQGCWETDPRRRPAAAEVAKELEMLQRLVVPRAYEAGGASSGVSTSNSAGPQSTREASAAPAPVCGPLPLAATTPGALIPRPAPASMQPTASNGTTGTEAHGDWSWSPPANQNAELASSVLVTDSIFAGSGAADSFQAPDGVGPRAPTDEEHPGPFARRTMTEGELHAQLAHVALMLE